MHVEPTFRNLLSCTWTLVPCIRSHWSCTSRCIFVGSLHQKPLIPNIVMTSYQFRASWCFKIRCWLRGDSYRSWNSRPTLWCMHSWYLQRDGWSIEKVHLLRDECRHFWQCFAEKGMLKQTAVFNVSLIRLFCPQPSPKYIYFWVLVSFVLRTLTLSLSLTCTVVGGRRFRPSVAVVDGRRFRPTSGHLELISTLMMLIQQQSEPLVEEWNMLTTIRTIGPRAKSVVGCKQIFLRVDGCCFLSVHVSTSFCCCELHPVVLRDLKWQSVFLWCDHANTLFCFTRQLSTDLESLEISCADTRIHVWWQGHTFLFLSWQLSVQLRAYCCTLVPSCLIHLCARLRAGFLFWTSCLKTFHLGTVCVCLAWSPPLPRNCCCVDCLYCDLNTSFFINFVWNWKLEMHGIWNTGYTVSPYQGSLLRGEWVPILFWMSIHVFVHSPVITIQGCDPSFFMESIFFNSILIQVVRNVDFQYWANFRVSSDPSFRRGSFIVSRWRIFSTWSSISAWFFHRLEVTCIHDMIQHIRNQSNPCHGLSWKLCTRNRSHKTSIFASKTHSNVFWKFYNLLLWCRSNFPWAGTLIEGRSVQIDTTLGEIRDSSASLISATVLSVLDEKGSEICWASSSHQSDTAP